jgi:F-type H+-transporting ATPase subunit b
LTLDSKKMYVLRYFLYYLAIILFIANIVFFTAENMKEGGELWNSIMLWVNFGIMAFFYFRFANRPLINMLGEEGNKISKRLQVIEADVKKARLVLDEEFNKLKKIDDNIEKITENILAVGTRERNSIIEKARAVADKMVEDAKIAAEYKMESAKKRFSEEMLDMAVSIALDNMRKNVTQEDNDRIVENFSLGLSDQKRRFA